MEKKYKICFSITVHEGIDFLEQQICLLCSLNPESAVVVHIAKQKNISEVEQKIIDKILGFGNVFFNTNRLNTLKYKILTPIVSNIEFSKDIDYEYLCLLASNELPFRKNIYGYIKNYDYGSDLIISDGTVMSQAKHQDCVRFSNFCGMNGQTYTGQHEGTFYKKKLALQISKKILEFCDLSLMNNLGDTTEESLLPTAVYCICNGLEKGRPISIIHERIPSLLGYNEFIDFSRVIDFIGKMNDKNSLDFQVSYNYTDTDLHFSFSVKRFRRDNSNGQVIEYIKDINNIK